MPKEKNKKILLVVVAIITLLISTIIFIVINPTNSPAITETREKILPFGKPTPADDTIVTNPDNGNSTYDDTGSQNAQKLTRITHEPVAGARLVTDENGKTTVKYVEQKTGDIYEYSLEDETSERILQQTLLGIHSALWSKNGNSTILRFLKTEETGDDTIKTYLLSLENNDGMSSTTSSVGKFLPDNLQEVVMSPANSEKIIYLQENNGGSFIMSENIVKDEERQQLFASSLNEWLVEWPKEDLILITTKPSYNIDGYSYFVDPENGEMKKVLGEIKGLTTLISPDATKILYAKSEKKLFDLVVYNVETKTETSLGLNTLPEKCVWGGENSNLLYCAVSNFSDNTNLPDDWYKGKISFSDELWLINTETGKSGILTPTKGFSGEGIDIIEISLSPNNDHLLFKNKKDGSLWMLKLEIIETEKDDTLSNTEETE